MHSIHLLVLSNPWLTFPFSISNAAALVFWTFCATKITTADSQWQTRLHIGKRKGSISLLAPRYRVTYIFAIMFLALTIILCLHLKQWNPDSEPGRCYSSHLVSNADNHPAGDLVYVITMAVWLFIGMVAAILGGPRRRRPILIFAFLQFPIHLYMALTLRTVNQEFLAGGEDENGWDFGQTTAVLLLGMAFSDLVKKLCEYFKFERELQRRGMHMVALTKSHPPSRPAEDSKAVDNDEGLAMERLISAEKGKDGPSYCNGREYHHRA